MQPNETKKYIIKQLVYDSTVKYLNGFRPEYKKKCKRWFSNLIDLVSISLSIKIPSM